MRRLIDKSAEHAACADLLLEIFRASMTLQAITAENFVRNSDIQRGMTALAKDLHILRRALHCEFASRASFDAVSPYSGFEGRLSLPSEEIKTPPLAS